MGKEHGSESHWSGGEALILIALGNKTTWSLGVLRVDVDASPVNLLICDATHVSSWCVYVTVV